MYLFIETIIANLKSALSLRRAFITQILMLIISNATFFSFWIFYFHRFEIGGWDLHKMSLLYGIVAGSYGLSCFFFAGSRYIAYMIQTGQLDCFITKPRHVLTQAVISKSLPSGFGDLISSLFFLIYSNEVGLLQVPFFLFFIITGCALIVSFAVILGSLAFFFSDSEQFGKQIFEFILTFCNYPDSIFSDGVRVILFTLIPSGFLGFLPAKSIINMNFHQGLFIVLGISVYGMVAYAMFYRGLKRYTSSNMFSVNER